MFRFALAVALVWLAATAAAASPPVEAYGKLPGVEAVSLSPSGQRYALIGSVGEQRRLIIGGGANEILDTVEIGPMKVIDLEWAGDDHILLHASSTVALEMEFAVDKTELASCIVYNLKTRKSFMVFGGKFQNRVARTVGDSYGVAEIGGRWYGYFGGFSYERVKEGSGPLKTGAGGRLYQDLYKVDLDTGQFEMAAEGQPGLEGWLVGPGGDVVARIHFNQSNGDWRIVGGGRKEALATGSAPTGDIRLGGFGRSSDILLVHTGEGGHDLIREVSLSGAQAGPAHDPDESGVSLLHRVSRLWIGTWEPGPAPAAKLFDPAMQVRLSGAYKAFPGYVVRLVSYSADFGHMILFTEGGDDSGTYWLVDIAKRAADPIGRPYPAVRSADVGPVRWVNYKAADGMAMRGVLTLPPGPARNGLPLVVMPHGGPESHDAPGFNYWAQAFASRGYAVFQPNFRGSTGSGAAFRDAGLGEWGRKMQSDISDGVMELARQGVADPKRACIVGWSYGGYAALAGVTVQQGLYRCAVSYGGVADLDGMLAYLRDKAGARTASMRAWKEFLGVTSTWGREIDAISPVSLAARADAPVLLIHGQDDTIVPAAQSAKMERALRAAGKPVELMTFPGADHWLLQEESRIAMVKASVAFVLKHNPPDAPAAVAEAGR